MAHQNKLASQQSDLMDAGCWSTNQRRPKILVQTRAPAPPGPDGANDRRRFVLAANATDAGRRLFIAMRFR
jgi:hypothetical protein